MKITVLLSTALFLAASFSSFGQLKGNGTVKTGTTAGPTCNKNLKSKSGKVYSAAPGVIEVANIQSSSVTFKIKKTAGKAATQVNYYINGKMQSQVNKFNNGSYKNPNWTTRTFNNMKGKKLTVKIVNQSVANTFSYTCAIQGKTSNLLNVSASTITGNLAGNSKKTFYTKTGCTNKTNITIYRTSGKARATYRVWEKQSNGTWKELLNENGTIEKVESNQAINVSSNKQLKIEVKNVSVGNFFGYKIKARVG